MEPANDQPTRKVRVLAIEGGGVRGIIPTRVLAALESLAGKPIAELFDIMVGTSTGGMLVLGLSLPDEAGRPVYTAEHVGDIYRTYGPLIFPKPTFSWPRSLDEARELWTQQSARAAMFGFNPEAGNARYSPQGIEHAFMEYFHEARLADSLVDVIVTAYDFQAKSAVLFRSAGARAHPDDPTRNPLMRDVARATSAAPTYLPPLVLDWDGVEERILVDGGVYAKNPSLIGYMEGVEIARERGQTAADVEVVFLGTGTPMRAQELSAKEFAGRTWLKLAEDIFRAAEDGQSALHDQALHTLLGEGYWPFQTVLSRGVSYAMDDISPENVEALTQLGDALVGQRIADLTRLARSFSED